MLLLMAMAAPGLPARAKSRRVITNLGLFGTVLVYGDGIIKPDRLAPD